MQLWERQREIVCWHREGEKERKRFRTKHDNNKWLLKESRCLYVCICLYVCDYESFRSVWLLCISVGLAEQTDTDTPAPQKSALLSKPTDVRKAVPVCMRLRVCVLAIHSSTAVRNEGESAHEYKYTLMDPPAHTYTHTHRHTEKVSSHINSVCGRKAWLHGNNSNNLTSNLLLKIRLMII